MNITRDNTQYSRFAAAEDDKDIKRAPSPPGSLRQGNSDNKIFKAKENSKSYSQRVFDEISTDSESDDDSTIADVKELFHKARHLLCPTAFYRRITYLYAERKLMVFFLVHLVSTLIIWCK